MARWFRKRGQYIAPAHEGDPRGFELAEPGDLGAGGGGSNVVHATDVPDQTITLADDSWSFPQHLADLWRVEGPGFWMLGLWYEVKPFDDNDQVMCQVMGTPEPTGAGRSFQVGPDSRAYASVGGSGSLAPGGGGWLRSRGGDAFPALLMPSEYQDFVLNIAGFHYNDADPGNFDIPLLGDVQIRNMRAIAVRLGE
jgi:hypothetical protein